MLARVCSSSPNRQPLCRFRDYRDPAIITLARSSLLGGPGGRDLPFFGSCNSVACDQGPPNAWRGAFVAHLPVTQRLKGKRDRAGRAGGRAGLCVRGAAALLLQSFGGVGRVHGQGWRLRVPGRSQSFWDPSPLNRFLTLVNIRYDWAAAAAAAPRVRVQETICFSPSFSSLMGIYSPCRVFRSHCK